MVWYSISFSGQDWKLGIERSKTCPVAKCDGSETDRAETRVVQSMWKFIRRKKRCKLDRERPPSWLTVPDISNSSPVSNSQYSIQNFLWFYPESFFLNTQQSSEIQKDRYIHTNHKVIFLTAPLPSPVQYRNEKIPSSQLELLFLKILPLGEFLVGLFSCWSWTGAPVCKIALYNQVTICTESQNVGSCLNYFERLFVDTAIITES